LLHSLTSGNPIFQQAQAKFWERETITHGFQEGFNVPINWQNIVGSCSPNMPQAWSLTTYSSHSQDTSNLSTLGQPLG